MSANISIYQNVRLTKGEVTSLDLFLSDIRSGRWVNDIIDFRNGKREKASLPAVTISGEFSERRISGLKEHSGFICIDIDNADPAEVKAIVCCDKYVYAAFNSVSGNGLAVLFKINPRKHAESFEGLQEYLFSNYEIVIDPSGKDVSRARFVSFDEEIFINEAAAKFAIYPKPKPAGLKKLPQTIFVQNDFDEIVNQVINRGIDMVDSYQDWLRICFSLADHFGEGGRHYFHLLSRVNHKYKTDKCDKQYTACLKAGKTGITISTFYWYCKQAGIETASKKTKLIATTAAQALKGGRDPESTVKLLQDIEGIPAIESKSIVQQVFDNKIDYQNEDSFIEELEIYLRQNYELKRNILTRKIENQGKPLEPKDFNSIYIACKKVFEKMSFEILDRIIHSDFTPEYNPLKLWIEQNQDLKSGGNIVKLCKTIQTDMPEDYVQIFVTKWLLGIVEAIHECDPSPLMLILTGTAMGTGKTEWFRRLLPRAIRSYYAESKLDKPKDDEILMTQKLIIMDDEMSGKSKKESEKLRNLTSAKWFSLREPYGRGNVDLRRLAVLCGTSNEERILFDVIGNRRQIPVRVFDIDKALYNSIDKSVLLIEVYNLWKAGYTSQLSREDIAFLNECTADFQAVSIERELIQRYFTPAEKEEIGADFLSTTDLKVKLEKYSSQRLNINKLGHELRNLGFVIKNGYNPKGARRVGYYVIQIKHTVTND